MNCMYNSAGPYLMELMNKTDIMVITEHGLFPCELYKLEPLQDDLSVISKSSKQLNDSNFGYRKGNGGVAIMWHKSISNFVIPLPNLGTDRMSVIQLQLPDTSKLFIIGVYMPHQSCQISNFRHELGALVEFISELSATGNVLLIGDTNCHLWSEHETRGWGLTTANGRACKDAHYKCDLIMIDMGETNMWADMYL